MRGEAKGIGNKGENKKSTDADGHLWTSNGGIDGTDSRVPDNLSFHLVCPVRVGKLRKCSELLVLYPKEALVASTCKCCVSVYAKQNRLGPRSKMLVRDKHTRALD